MKKMANLYESCGCWVLIAKCLSLRHTVSGWHEWTCKYCWTYHDCSWRFLRISPASPRETELRNITVGREPPCPNLVNLRFISQVGSPHPVVLFLRIDRSKVLKMACPLWQCNITAIFVLFCKLLKASGSMEPQFPFLIVVLTPTYPHLLSQATGLHFRHTDNVIQWLNAMSEKGLPKVSLAICFCLTYNETVFTSILSKTYFVHI